MRLFVQYKASGCKLEFKFKSSKLGRCKSSSGIEIEVEELEMRKLEEDDVEKDGSYNYK